MKKLPSDLKQVLSANLKLMATSERGNLLQQVTLANHSSLTSIVWVAFENSKLSSDIRLQKHQALIKLEKEVWYKASLNLYIKKTRQHKGTPAVQRRLMALIRTCEQFTDNINNQITKQIVTFKNLVKLEETFDLRIFPNYTSKEIYKNRVQETGNKGQCCHLYPVSYYLKQRKTNVSQLKWSYAELNGLIHYKVVRNNSSIRVDTNYCSQFHPCWRHTNKYNCLNKGVTIRCSKNRGFKLCADLVGGQNVAMKTLLLGQNSCHKELQIVTAYPPKSLFPWNKIMVSFLKGLRGVRQIFMPKTLHAFMLFKSRVEFRPIKRKIRSLGLESRKGDFSSNEMLLSF